MATPVVTPGGDMRYCDRVVWVAVAVDSEAGLQAGVRQVAVFMMTG